MRVSFKHVVMAGWLAAAGCGGDASDNAPGSTDGVKDAGKRSDASTSRTDAGRKDASSDNGDDSNTDDSNTDDSNTDDSNGDDAGASSSVDAGKGATHDAGGTGTGGSGDAGATGSTGETGRMVGMTAAHNAVRAKVQTNPMLANMVWDPTVAAYAQQWADQLAGTQSTCDKPMHRTGDMLGKVNYGENLATKGAKSFGGGMSTNPVSDAAYAVGAWAGEVQCWTYGTINDPPYAIGTEKCDQACYSKMGSDGCGHYTQIVWRTSTKLGCGVATCTTSMGYTQDIWICNYAPAGNIAGKAPY